MSTDPIAPAVAGGRRQKIQRNGELRFKRLKGMPSFVEVDRMVRCGTPLKEIVEFVKDSGEYEGVEDHTLMSLLSEYRGSMPAGEVTALVQPRKFLQKVEEFDEGLSELEELENLAAMQADRLQRFYKSEKQLGLPMPLRGMVREIEAYREILVDSAKLKILLGMDPRKRERLEHQARAVEMAQNKYGLAIAQVIGNDEKRRKILNVIDRIRSKGELGTIIDMDDADRRTETKNGSDAG